MANLYLDHDISARMIIPLRGRGHILVTADAVGKAAATDDEHFLSAAKEGRVFVTHNIKDFTLLHRAWQRWSAEWGVTRPHAGILVIPQPGRLAIPDAVAELDGFLVANPVLTNAMYVLRVNVGWRRLP